MELDTLDVRTKTQATDEPTDEALRRSLHSHLWKCGYAPPDHSIRIDASEGVVTIQGRVAIRSDVRVVETLVAAHDGVHEVRNLLSVPERRRHR